MRIVSLIGSATEIVCALGLRDQLVGRSHECDYPPSIRALPKLTEPKIVGSAPRGEIDKGVGEAGKYSPAMRWEDLVAKDPDIVLAVPCGFDIPRTRQEMERLTTKPEWSRLKAVRAGRVFVGDGTQYFNRPGPRLVETLEILAELFHPRQYHLGHRGSGWQAL